MFARCKFQIWLIAIAAVLVALTGAFPDEHVAYAQGREDDYVDVGLILEVPFRNGANEAHDLKIIVVNDGSIAAYDVEVVVDVVYPKASSRFDSFTADGVIKVPVGSTSLENSNYRLRWSIPALGGLQREEVTVNVTHEVPSEFYNSLDPHEYSGKVTTSSFESNLHKGNNTSRVWGYNTDPDLDLFMQAAGNYSVAVAVGNPLPSPGDTVNFTITTDRANPFENLDFTTKPAPPIDLKVDIQLTGGLSVSGTPTYASGAPGANTTVPDSVSYGNGVFTIGTLKAGEPTRNAMTLPVRLSDSAVANEQCLTATLTGNPPPGTGPLDDDVSDNVAKVCLGQILPYFTSADLHEFVSHPCVGDSSHPCDNTDDVRVRAIYAAVDPPVILGAGVPVIYVPDTSETRKFDSDADSVNAGDKLSWQVPVQISYRQYTSDHERWTDVSDSFSYEMPGKSNFDKLHIRTTWGKALLNNEQREAAFLATYNPGSTADSNGPFPLIAEFEELGVYKVYYAITATHDNNTPGDTSDDVEYPATGSYIFHVGGPIAELGVRDGGASPDLAADQYAITVEALNNRQDSFRGARVTGLPTGAEVIHISQGSYDDTAGVWNIGELKYRDRLRPEGRPEGATLVLGASAGDTATARIVYDPYLVCVGSDGSTLMHTVRAACENVTGASWHEGAVFDYNADNDEATLRARRGTAGVSEDTPRPPPSDGTPSGSPVRSVPAAIVVEWSPVQTVNGWQVSHYELERDQLPWSSGDGPTLTHNVACLADATRCRYVDIDAQTGQSYSYRVRAVNLPGVKGPWSRSMEIIRQRVTAGAPEAPVLSATPRLGKERGRILLSWNKPKEGGAPIIAYTLQVSDTGLSESSWRDASPQPVPGEDAYEYIYPPEGEERLTGGTRKHFRLRATNNCNPDDSAEKCHSPWSQVVSATIEGSIKPGAPVNVLAAGAIGADAGSVIIVRWQPPPDDGGTPLTGYEVQWSSNGETGWRTAARVDADTLSFEDTGLDWGTTRYYRVAARNSVGIGPWSDPPAPGSTAEQDQMEGVSVPGAPTNLRLTPGNQQMTVAWDAPASDGGSPIRGYRVMYRHRDPDRGKTGAWQAWQELSHFTADTSVTMTGMYNHVEYQVKVAAVNGVGTSLYTPVATGIYDPQWVPGEPPNVEFEPGDGRIKVTWREPWNLGNPELTGYRVQYRVDGSAEWLPATPYSVGRSARSYTIRGLTNCTTYQVQVWAVNAEGDSPKAGADGKLKATPKSTQQQNCPVNVQSLANPRLSPDNQPPSADAGPDQSVNEGDTVTLAGKGTDPEGKTLTYAWTAPEGITLSDATVANPTFTAPERTEDYTLTFSLVVNDGSSDSAADTVDISVTVSDDGDEQDGAGGEGKADNQPPTADAGPDQSVNEGDTVTLAGTGTDPEGKTLTYAWTAPEGITLSDATAANPTFTAPDRTEDYTLTFSLVVNDGTSDSEPATVDISVTVSDGGDNEQEGAGGEGGADGAGGEGKADNEPPGAPSLTDQTAKVGTAFSYQFAAVTDPEGATPTYTALLLDSDGMTSALPGWLAFDAGTRAFSCAASGDGACEAGALTIRVIASDGASPTPATSYADFTITVSAAESTNSPPSFDQSSYAFDLAENADGSGVDAAIALGAVSATDPDSGDTVEYSIADGNDGGLFALDSSSGVITYTGAGENFEGFTDDPKVEDDGPAFAYTLTVQASDGKASVTVSVTIRVTDVDEPPTAGAGPDQAVSEGVAVTLAGSGYDPEGKALTYAWTAPEGIP